MATWLGSKIYKKIELCIWVVKMPLWASHVVLGTSESIKGTKIINAVDLRNVKYITYFAFKNMWESKFGNKPCDVSRDIEWWPARLPVRVLDIYPGMQLKKRKRYLFLHKGKLREPKHIKAKRYLLCFMLLMHAL